MAQHLLSNRLIELTNDEWKLCQEVIKRYTNLPTQKGEDYFQGLFETDDNGYIIFLRPPLRHTPMEIPMLLQNYMINQQLRISHQRVDQLCGAVEQKLKLLDAKLQELDAKK
jgi:hypothetical protein